LKEEVITFAKLAMHEWAKLMKQALCTSLAKAATSWREKVSAMRDIPSSTMPVIPKAIEDAHY
ncbi:MAG: hypothetical protein ACKPKO_40750, partial [Candidatus Fonsibacter sp.]